MWWFVIMIWDMTCFYVLLASHSGIKSCQSCSRHYKTHEPWSKGLVFLKALREWLRRSSRAAYAPTVWVYAQNSLPWCLRGIASRISLTKNSFERGSHWHHRQSHYTYITNTNDTHVINCAQTATNPRICSASNETSFSRFGLGRLSTCHRVAGSSQHNARNVVWTCSHRHP